MALAGADGLAVTTTHSKAPPAICRHSNVPDVFLTPEPLHLSPATSVATDGLVVVDVEKAHPPMRERSETEMPTVRKRLTSLTLTLR